MEDKLQKYLTIISVTNWTDWINSKSFIFTFFKLFTICRNTMWKHFSRFIGEVFSSKFVIKYPEERNILTEFHKVEN
jgi:hypothetical protein